jgi:hypothetical protein
MTVSHGKWDEAVTWGDEEVRGSGTVDMAGNQEGGSFWCRNDQVSREAFDPKHGVGMNLKFEKGAPGIRPHLRT